MIGLKLSNQEIVGELRAESTISRGGGNRINNTVETFRAIVISGKWVLWRKETVMAHKAIVFYASGSENLKAP